MQAKLIAETDRLSLKSEFEVKIEILRQENVALVEERKLIKQNFREEKTQLQSQNEILRT
jgi:hypothetical protein